MWEENPICLMKTIYLIVALCFLSIFTIQAQLIAKEKNNKFGYVDSFGKMQIPNEYTIAFTDTLKTIAFVGDNGKIWAIDKNNKKLFEVFNFDSGPDYECEGLFRIVGEDGKMGFANNQGEIIIAPTYFFVRPFSNGFAAFNVGGERVLVNNIDNYTRIVGGKWGYIDKTGTVVFPAIFDNVDGFEDKKSVVKIGEHIFNIYEE